MDKVIQDIVAIDLKCTQAVKEAKKKKLSIQSDMSIKKKEIYNSFLQEYQSKIDQRKKELQDQINQTKEKNELDYQEALCQLTNLYEENKDQWVATLVDRCKEI